MAKQSLKNFLEDQEVPAEIRALVKDRLAESKSESPKKEK